MSASLVGSEMCIRDRYMAPLICATSKPATRLSSSRARPRFRCATRPNPGPPNPDSDSNPPQRPTRPKTQAASQLGWERR
eukprot:6776599-Alexandrium_andersonii.AAC.1